MDDESPDNAQHARTDDNGGHNPPEHKRSRPEEWPCKRPELQQNSLPQSEERSQWSEPHDPKRDSATSDKPSKFLEGSMNDRVSNRPPSLYTKEDEAMERYWGPSSASNPAKRYSNKNYIYPLDAGIETPKPSGMYRFGRAIVNAFKPVAAWRGASNARDEREKQDKLEKSIMQERQEKAEKAYAELKKTGFKGTQMSSGVKENTEIPSIKYEDTTDNSRLGPFRDSGIDMDECRSSGERQRGGLEPHSNTKLMPPPQNLAVGRSTSPMSEAASSRRSSLQFRKPSFQNLKKVKSSIQLPPAKKQSMLPPVDSSAESNQVITTTPADQFLRKQPSRKDIAKQQRLNKRISDLESQLEIARRNLRLTMNDLPACTETISQKGVKPFKPGALPSLPSESILKRQNIDEKNKSGAISNTNSSDVTSTERHATMKSSSSEDVTVHDPTSQLNQELRTSVSMHTIVKKRKSINCNEETYDKTDWDVENGIVRNETNPMGQMGVLKNPSGRNVIEEPIANTDPKTQRKKQRKGVSRTPRNSQHKHVEPVPPLPLVLTSFDPARVDQAKIMSMRSTRDSNAPFGQDLDDITNIRREYPTITETQLADCLASLAKDSKATDHTSLSHHNQPATPCLPPPCSSSPIKAEPHKSSRLRTPAAKVSQDLQKNYAHLTSLTPLMASQGLNASGPSKANNHPLSPSSLTYQNTGNKNMENEKPLPNIQKEDYEWPEDVF